MTEPTAIPYFRTPTVDPDGQRIAFVYGGDLWLAAITGGTAERITAHPASHSSPRFSPDGRWLAFRSPRTGNGEVYVLPLEGGAVRQLTYHGEKCMIEDWTTDGQSLIISTDREQFGTSLYQLPLDGSTPILLYNEPYEQLGCASVAPDGCQLAFCNLREQWWRRGPNPFAPSEIWLAPLAPDYTALRLLVGPAQPGTDWPLAAPYAGRNAWPLWAPDGRGIYFVSDRDGVENFWYASLDGSPPVQVTYFRDGRLLFPQIARRTGLLVFERDWQIWCFDPRQGQPEPIPLRTRGDGKVTPVREDVWTRGLSELRLSPDGKKVAFVARGEVFADFADKETDRELRQGPAFRVTDTRARERQIAWSPDSRSLVYISDRHGEDELYRYDFTTRQETRLTSDLTPKQLPRISPDGKWVAFLSGFERVCLIGLQGGEVREVCRARFVVATDLAWSPDSRWLAFITHDERFFSNVALVPFEGGTPRQISFLSNVGGGDLRWAPNGQFIVFTTEQYRAEAQIVRVDLRPPSPLFREAEFEKLFEEKKKEKEPIKPEPSEPAPTPGEGVPADEPPLPDPTQMERGEEVPPMSEDAAAPPEQSAAPADDPPTSPAPANGVTIVFEGIERRLRFLTPIQMDASVAAISPDSKDLLLLAVVAGKVNLWTLPLDEPRADQPLRQLTASEGSKYAVQFAPDGRSFYYLEDGMITVRKFPSGGEPVRVGVRAEVTIDFHSEKRQIFGEAWRALRDSFYDPTFRGQDWAALRNRFAPLVEGAQTTAELHTAINLMVGELRASHLGSGFGEWSSSDGYTGIIVDPLVLRTEGRLQVARVIPDSPAAMLETPPQVGEQLVAIDGIALQPGVSLDRLLRRTVGRRVRLQLQTADGSRREVALRPLDAAGYWQLRYRDWVSTNEAYVHRISAGRLGYVHIKQMSYPAYQQFLADLDVEAHSKQGVVLDVRYNGGGHTATFILDVLMRRTSLLSSFRERVAADAGHLAGNRVLNKPTVLVTNERSASNTEMLSESYQRMGLGRVVGRPTAGAVIWTYNVRLLDGATLRLPQMAVMTPEGEDLEGRGRPVDVEVARPLGEWVVGRDRQLEAAVATLLTQLEAAKG